MAINNPPSIKPPRAEDLLRDDAELQRDLGTPQFQTAADAQGGLRLEPPSGGFDFSSEGPLAAPQARPAGASRPGATGQVGTSEFDPTSDLAANPLNTALQAYSLGMLEEPSRFATAPVRSGMELINRELGRAREESTADLEEFMSQRGLVGSSVEAEEQRKLQEGLDLNRLRRLHDLESQLAQTSATDRATAADVARGTLGFGLAGSELDLRAKQLQQEALLEGRALDLQQARQLAQEQLTREAMAQDERMFGRELGQREREFAAQFGLEENRFMEQQRQFSRQMQERVASRLQQESQFARQLAQEDARMAMEKGLRERSMDLQEEGMNLDEAFRRASLEQETDLRQRALDLEQQGLTMDDAYRYAALEQDSRFRERAQELQEKGMDLDEAYRRAQLEQQEELATRELDIREEEFKNEQRQEFMRLLLQALSAVGLDPSFLEGLGGGDGNGNGNGNGESPEGNPPPDKDDNEDDHSETGTESVSPTTGGLADVEQPTPTEEILVGGTRPQGGGIQLPGSTVKLPPEVIRQLLNG